MKRKVKQSNKKISDKTEQQQVAEPTSDEVELQLDELAATPKRERVWEVDFLRGLMILFVVWDHFWFDISMCAPYKTEFFNLLYKFSVTYYSATGIRQIAQPVFVTMFVFTSGVSCSFSRSNGKRAIKMIAFACLLTAGTYAVSAITNTNLTIHFNVIHAIALSTLLWTLIEFAWAKCSKNWQKNIFGVVMTAVTLTAIVVGAYANFKPWTSDNKIWFFLAQHVGSDYNNFCGGDYLPFLPDFGWFLVGAFLGRVIYKEKKTIFPSFNPKFVCPVTFCGRHSLWVYFGSQIVMFGVIYLLSSVLGWV